jgi:hypothetical protein
MLVEYFDNPRALTVPEERKVGVLFVGFNILRP